MALPADKKRKILEQSGCRFLGFVEEGWLSQVDSIFSQGRPERGNVPLINNLILSDGFSVAHIAPLKTCKSKTLDDWKSIDKPDTLA